MPIALYLPEVLLKNVVTKLLQKLSIANTLILKYLY
jgi:hypothetical protein